MIFLTNFSAISDIKGVEHYILVDKSGKTLAHNIKEYQKTGFMICRCGRHLETIGKNRLKFTIFKRKNKKDLFIFPFGDYYLGVIKEEDITACKLAQTVLSFLNNLRLADKTGTSKH